MANPQDKIKELLRLDGIKASERDKLFSYGFIETKKNVFTSPRQYNQLRVMVTYKDGYFAYYHLEGHKPEFRPLVKDKNISAMMVEINLLNPEYRKGMGLKGKRDK